MSLLTYSTLITAISTLSLHDALPICSRQRPRGPRLPSRRRSGSPPGRWPRRGRRDRKSTRLNSSHRCISYAVFCLKKKKDAKANGLHWSAVRGQGGDIHVDQLIRAGG